MLMEIWLGGISISKITLTSRGFSVYPAYN